MAQQNVALQFTLSERIDVSGFTRFSQKRRKLFDALEAKLNALDQLMVERMVAKLTGGLLQRRTGVLADSVKRIPATSKRLEGLISGGVRVAGGKAFYGRYLEFGTDSYISMTAEAMRAKALHFMTGPGGTVEVFAARVGFGPSGPVQVPPIRARAYASSTAEEMDAEIRAGLRETVLQVLQPDR